jgi:hypothetical protein
MTISKYEQTLADQSRHIIESDGTMKPILDKIEDLDKDSSIHTSKYCIHLYTRTLLYYGNILEISVI